MGGPSLRRGVPGAGEIAADFTDALHRHASHRVAAVEVLRTMDSVRDQVRAGSVAR